MKASAVRKWSWVHKWSSLVCTVFLLFLCITGLPLIFHHEIDHLLHEDATPAARAADAPWANLDAIVANAVAKVPGHFPQFLSWDKDEPGVVSLSLGEKPDSDPQKNRVLTMDAGNAQFLKDANIQGRITYFILRLHTDIFLGLPAKLFLGFMGILFVVAIVSGVVVYGPSMRKLDFGTVRRDRSRFAKWLDLHNLLGAVTIMWVVVVGFTGVINTWADLVIKVWQYGQLGEMLGPYKDRPRPEKLAPVDAAVKLAQQTIPEMSPAFVAFPGSVLTSKSHYAIFMRGNTPLTSRLLKPVLIDASDGKFTDSRNLPWYVTALLVSQPLHFGDYGGMPLKIIWAILDVIAIFVLGSGLYLWLAKRKSASPHEAGETHFAGAARNV